MELSRRGYQLLIRVGITTEVEAEMPARHLSTAATHERGMDRISIWAGATG